VSFYVYYALELGS